MSERRQNLRLPVEIFFNKYIGGLPFLCRARDLSASGALADTFVEPSGDCQSFAVEIKLPAVSKPIWAWARMVRRVGGCQALRFLAIGAEDRRTLDRFLAQPA